MNKKTFSYRQHLSLGTILLIILFPLLFVSITISFFYSSDYASNLIGMTGKVDIEAVGDGKPDPDNPGNYIYSSIENTHTSNLIVSLSDGYSVLIPGMDVTVNANCKVYRSTTQPLLRAKLDFIFKDITGQAYEDSNLIVSDLYGKLLKIVQDNGWYLHTDSYFYYLGDVVQPDGAKYGDQIMKEIDVTQGDKVIPFLDKSFKFPTTVDSGYSGDKVEFKITFQAIQNFIPDKFGKKLDNTITNSLKIFDQFYESYSNTTNISNFAVTRNANGQYEINVAPGVVLPEVVVLPTHDADGNEITHIGSSFKENSQIKSITIPETYTSMDDGAFRYSSIVSADLSNSKIKELPYMAFYGSKLETILLPDGIEILGQACLSDIPLKSIVLPETLKEIQKNAFWTTKTTSIRSIFIPRNVTSIGSEVFNYLSEIVVDEENPNYKDYDDKMLLTSDGKLLLYGSSLDSEEALIIPEGVVSLGARSISGCPSKTVYLPASLTTIENNVFSINVTNVIIDENNTTFSSDGTALFNYDQTIMFLFIAKEYEGTYEIPDSVVTIQDGAIYKRTIETLKIGKNVSSSPNTFEDNSITNFIVDEDNQYLKDDKNLAVYSKDGTILGAYAVENSATSYRVLDTTTTIGYGVFLGASRLNTIILPEGLQNVDTNAFYYCTMLTTINIPSSIQNLGIQTFMGCSELESITVYGTLDNAIFKGCSKLKNVVVYTNGNQSIGNNIFSNCSSLESIEFKSVTPPTFTSDNLFTGASTTWSIYVPDSAVDTYKAVPQLANYVNRIYPVSQKPNS